MSETSTTDVTKQITFSLLNVTHLNTIAPQSNKSLPNHRPSGKPFATYVGDGDIVIGSIVQSNAIPNSQIPTAPQTTHTLTSPPTTASSSPTRLISYLRAGPRLSTYHDPATSCAAIVTCGGLCPGMNDVVSSLTKTLRDTYQVPRVLGVRGGWWGFHDANENETTKTTKTTKTTTNKQTQQKGKVVPPMELTTTNVDGAQHVGGTMLGSSRGGFDAEIILKSCIKWGVNLLFVIGGDGSHRGALAVANLAKSRHLPMSVAGIPKTIDNDIGMIDRSFGFESAVAEAKKAIKSAKIEASCAPNGIGIVKLMGRDSGYIAAHSTISSHGDVDLLLIPELALDLDPSSKTNVFDHIGRVLDVKGHAVVVLSEGAGAEHLLKEQNRSSKTSADGTQPKLPPIGVYMKKRIQEHFDAIGTNVTVKYIDPSYMIRSVPANAFDSMYALMLGQNAVHGAMAGYTGFSAGLCNNRSVYLPISELLALSPRRIRSNGRTVERILAVTGQPMQ